MTLETSGRVVLLRTPRYGDARGWFSETWSRARFAAAGIDCDFVQDNQSRSEPQGVVRGLHFQTPPYAQAKLVRCLRGAILDVAVDLRVCAPTFGQAHAVELSADTGDQLFVPPGFAHGFLTLTDDADVLYQMGAAHRPEAARGFRWDDPRFGIAWPFAPEVISARDATYADFEGFDA